MHFSQITKQSLATNKSKLRGMFKVNTLIHIVNGTTSCDFPFLNLTQPKKLHKSLLIILN